MSARFRTSDDYEPDTEFDPTSPTGESLDSGMGEADRRGLADHEASRWEDAFWGHGA